MILRLLSLLMVMFMFPVLRQEARQYLSVVMSQLSERRYDMTYIPSDKLITTPVSISDAQTCLGTSSTDLATLCMNKNINRWSAFKPVYMAKKQTLSPEDYANGRMNAVSGYMIAYGIKIKKSNVITDYIDTNFQHAGGGEVISQVWDYDKPQKDGTNFFRLTDFNNYYHNVNINLRMTFPTSEYFYIPQTTGESGQVIHFNLSWRDLRGAVNASHLFNATNSMRNYVPSVILTYYVSGISAEYVKSAKNGDSYLHIGDVGSSSLFGAFVAIDSRDILLALNHDNITLPNTQLQWTACWVLLERGVAGSATDHRAFYPDTPSININVVRFEYQSEADRVHMMSVPRKKAFISSISMVTTVEKQTYTPSGNYHRWNCKSIVFTFEKETDDTITFDVWGSFSCQVGNAYVSGMAPDSQGRYHLSDHLTVTGRGTKTISFDAAYQIYYMPTAPEQYSNVIRFSGSLQLISSSYGTWDGDYGIETAPSEPFGTLSKTTNLV